MPSEHVLSEQFIQSLRRQLLRGMLPVAILAVGGAWYMLGARTELADLLPLMVIGLVVFPIVLWINIRRQTKSFRSLVITLTDSSLAKAQDGYARIEIPLAEISAIDEFPGKGLVARGATPRQIIFLSDELIGFEDLRSRLALGRTITPKSVPSGQLVNFLGGLAGIAGLVIYRAESRSMILVTGILLIAVLVACFVAMVRSPHLDKRVKRSAWAVWLVVLSIGGRMAMALTGT
jgi:uncharacterized membrane protein